MKTFTDSAIEKPLVDNLTFLLLEMKYVTIVSSWYIYNLWDLQKEKLRLL